MRNEEGHKEERTDEMNGLGKSVAHTDPEKSGERVSEADSLMKSLIFGGAGGPPGCDLVSFRR